MRERAATIGLRALSLVYLASASAYGVAIAMQSESPWAVGVRSAYGDAEPVVRSWTQTAAEKAKPAGEWIVAKDKAFFAWYDPPRDMARKSYPLPQHVARATPPLVLRPAIIPVVPEPQVAAPQPPAIEVAPPAPVVAANPPSAPAAKQPLELADRTPLPPPAMAPVPDANPPSPAELDRVLTHLKVSLTRELYDNFSLFLYVSKADKGPWAQRMYVFRKETDGNLKMLYEWPVSTGRELIELAPDGTKQASFTPQGYYELDPDRMYRNYHSTQWDQPMPYAMFFNWEKGGYQTGLAIHGATGADISLLGERSSAGCVHLDPKNAALLFHLIRADYKGLAPRFAYDSRTATMDNNGFLMHDKAGNLEYAEGYKVLVFIENDGGANVVAALF
jgi:lipoprotein-anchoring transpeptidase ErfK/SrfK